MTLTAADTSTIRTLFNEGVETLIIPRFEQIDKRFNILDARMDSLEQRLGSLEQRLEVLEQRMNVVEGSLAKLDRQVGSLTRETHAGFASINDQLLILEGKVEALENDVKELYHMTAQAERLATTDVPSSKNITVNVQTLHTQLHKLAKQAGISLPPL